jgi:hypothetical protein
MTLLDLQIDLHRTNELLTRIADALDRAIPILPNERLGMKRRGLDSLSSYGDNNRLWAKENLYNLIHDQGLAPAQEQELLNQSMAELSDEIEALNPEQ